MHNRLQKPAWGGTTRAEDAEGTPTQSDITKYTSIRRKDLAGVAAKHPEPPAESEVDRTRYSD